AARAKALRPWYRKKRFIFGIPLLAIIGLIIIGSLSSSNEPASTAASSSSQNSGISTTSGESGEPDGIGDLVSIGSLDLTVEAVEIYDSKQDNPFNDANVRVRIQATNVR